MSRAICALRRHLLAAEALRDWRTTRELSETIGLSMEQASALVSSMARQGMLDVTNVSRRYVRGDGRRGFRYVPAYLLLPCAQWRNPVGNFLTTEARKAPHPPVAAPPRPV